MMTDWPRATGAGKNSRRRRPVAADSLDLTDRNQARFLARSGYCRQPLSVELLWRILSDLDDGLTAFYLAGQASAEADFLAALAGWAADRFDNQPGILMTLTEIIANPRTDPALAGSLIRRFDQPVLQRQAAVRADLTEADYEYLSRRLTDPVSVWYLWTGLSRGRNQSAATCQGQLLLDLELDCPKQIPLQINQLISRLLTTRNRQDWFELLAWQPATGADDLRQIFHETTDPNVLMALSCHHRTPPEIREVIRTTADSWL